MDLISLFGRFISGRILLLMVLTTGLVGQVKYHALLRTASDPVLSRRCIDTLSVKNEEIGFVRETDDSLDRPVRIDFLTPDLKPLSFWAFFPETITFEWGENTLLVTKYDGDTLAFSEMTNTANRTIYHYNATEDSIVKNSYHNNIFLRKSVIPGSKFSSDVEFYLLYTGCEKKRNSNYGMEF